MTPLIHEEIFPFERIAEAHSLLESGKATGKIVLRGFGIE
ncbi:MAG: zinc-binding dehydrogenase [Verrucomicrobiota bacterium]|nr:zinc-binding dehydrogenase [Verrucomicrobiota bacterium]